MSPDIRFSGGGYILYYRIRGVNYQGICMQNPS